MRSNQIDRLKFWAAIVVVLLHGHWLKQVSPLADFLTVNGLFRTAVPVFAVISGYYLAQKPYERWTGWILKILAIYVVWMVIYLPLWLPTDLSFRSLPGMLKTLALGYHHLWYLPAIALAAFVFRLAHKHALFLPGVILFAAAGVALQYQADLNDGPQLFTYRNGLTFLLPMFAIGFWLNGPRKVRVTPWMLAATMLAVLAESFMFFSIKPDISLDVPLTSFVAAPLLVLYAIQRTAVHDCKPYRVYQLSDWIYFTHILILSFYEQFVDPLSSSVLTVVTAVGLGYLSIDLRAKLSRRGIPV